MLFSVPLAALENDDPTAPLLTASCVPAFVAGAMAAAAHPGAPAPSARDPADPANIVLLTLDTTRADHLGSAGWPHARDAEPRRAGAPGTRFERCDSAAPITLPSHATILSGLFPPRHGVRDNGTFVLAPSVATLAERLRRPDTTPPRCLGGGAGPPPRARPGLSALRRRPRRRGLGGNRGGGAPGRGDDRSSAGGSCRLCVRRSSSGCTTTTRTRSTGRRPASPTPRVDRTGSTTARSPTWTARSGACSPPCPRPRSWPPSAITARCSASTASSRTACCPSREPVGCRCCSPARASLEAGLRAAWRAPPTSRRRCSPWPASRPPGGLDGEALRAARRAADAADEPPRCNRVAYYRELPALLRLQVVPAAHALRRPRALPAGAASRRSSGSTAMPARRAISRRRAGARAPLGVAARAPARGRPGRSSKRRSRRRRRSTTSSAASSPASATSPARGRRAATVAGDLPDPRDRVGDRAGAARAAARIQQGGCRDVLRELQRIVRETRTTSRPWRSPDSACGTPAARRCAAALRAGGAGESGFRRAGGQRRGEPPAARAARRGRARVPPCPGARPDRGRLGGEPGPPAARERPRRGGARRSRPRDRRRRGFRPSSSSSAARCGRRPGGWRRRSPTSARRCGGRRPTRCRSRTPPAPSSSSAVCAEAALAYETLARLTPARADVWKTLVALYLETGAVAEVERCAREALRLESDPADRARLEELLAGLAAPL